MGEILFPLSNVFIVNKSPADLLEILKFLQGSKEEWEEIHSKIAIIRSEQPKLWDYLEAFRAGIKSEQCQLREALQAFQADMKSEQHQVRKD